MTNLPKSVQEEMAELDRQVVATIMGRQVTRGQLAQAFNRVADKANWKMPIDAEVVIESGDYEMETIREAVTFFTGSYARFDFVRIARMISANDSGAGVYRCRAAGYYRTCGA